MAHVHRGVGPAGAPDGRSHVHGSSRVDGASTDQLAGPATSSFEPDQLGASGIEATTGADLLEKDPFYERDKHKHEEIHKQIHSEHSAHDASGCTDHHDNCVFSSGYVLRVVNGVLTLVKETSLSTFHSAVCHLSSSVIWADDPLRRPAPVRRQAPKATKSHGAKGEAQQGGQPGGSGESKAGSAGGDSGAVAGGSMSTGGGGSGGMAGGGGGGGMAGGGGGGGAA